MSNNLTPAQKLTALVTAHRAGSAQRPCALERIDDVIDDDPAQFGNYYAARKLGFTDEEAAGVMRGWDLISRSYCEGTSVAFWAGYELGKMLRERCMNVQSDG